MLQVKFFDEEHEKDLEEAMNAFLAEKKEKDIVDITYQMSHFSDGPGQIFSYSAMVLYRKSE